MNNSISQNTENSILKSPPPKISLKKPRNASFELLRIISMIFIIAHHFRIHGGWANVTGVNAFFMNLTATLFVPSVNLFVMISAYFLSAKDDMKIPWKKLGKIWLTVFFYSIVLFAIFTGLGIYKFDKQWLLMTLFPVAFSEYWFVSAYFLMLVASPFLNAIAARLNKAQFSALCIAIILIAVLQWQGVFQTLTLNGGYNGIWFCLLYLLTAYIRKFDIQLNNVLWAIGAVVFVGIIAINMYVWKYEHYTTIVGVYMSLFIFLTAKKIKITNAILSKVICFISSLTFGIFLIHESKEIRGFMYENIFHGSKFIPSDYSFLIFIGFVLLTFTVCGVAECIRQFGFNACAKLIKRIFGEKLNILQNKIKTFIEKISDKINGVQDENLLIKD